MVKVSSRSVLVLIDVQKGSSDPIWGKRNNPDADKTMKEVLEKFRKNGLTVIHVRQEDYNETPSLFRAGEPTFEFEEEVTPKEGETIITKHKSNAFIGTNLEIVLKQLVEPEIYYAGLLTDQCVSSTVRMSGDLGFKSYIIEDACATYGLQNTSGKPIDVDIIHEVSLASLNGSFAKVLRSKALEF